MGRATPVYNEKNFLEVSIGLSFQSMPSQLKLWKIGKMQSYFSTGQIFFHPEIWQVSKYTAILRANLVSLKREKISLIFGWEIYVTVEPRILCSYGKLYIWTFEIN